MNESTLLPLSQLYFIKIQQIHRRMMHLRMKFQQSYSTNRKSIAVRDKLTLTLTLTLFDCFITFPSTHTDIADTACDFLRKHGYPLCLGAVDRTQISVATPLKSQTDYYNSTTCKLGHLVGATMHPYILAPIWPTLFEDPSIQSTTCSSTVSKSRPISLPIQHSAWTRHWWNLIR